MTLTAPLEPKRRDKERRQRSLIEAATAVFAEHGYDAATTREVAERAGCSEGLIHRYFGGKRGLLLAVMENRAAEVLEEFKSGLPECQTIQEEIERILLWLLKVLWEHRDFMRVAISQAIIDPDLGRSVAERIIEQRVGFILERLRRHQQAGSIRPDVDLHAIAQTIAGFGFTAGFLAQVVIGMDREQVRRIAIAVAAALSRGIGVEPPAEPRKVATPVSNTKRRLFRRGDRR